MLYYKLYNLSLMELALVDSAEAAKVAGIKNLLRSLKGFISIKEELDGKRPDLISVLYDKPFCPDTGTGGSAALGQMLDTAGRLKNELLQNLLKKIRVDSLRYDGKLKYGWEGWVINDNPETIVLETHWVMKRPVSVGMFDMETGDVGIEVYFKHRPFNFFFVRGMDHKPKGWYCNLCLPVNKEGACLSYRDLILDYVISPSGQYTILDSDEFHEKQDSLSHEIKSRVNTARREFQEILDTQGLYFLYYYTFFKG